jgi:restriction system protein
MAESKDQQLARLAKKRQRTKWEGFGNLKDYGYECEFVSPYTKSAGNVDARVFVLLQDWSSADTLSRGPNEMVAHLGYTPKLPTNKRLDRLLNDHFGLERISTYATNLFPFIKRGGISARISPTYLRTAAIEFAWPQINIVKPKLVIALGLATFDALRQTAIGSNIGRLKDAIANPFDHDGVRVWCQAHTGSRGTVNAGGDAVVNANWKTMAVWFHQPR